MEKVPRERQRNKEPEPGQGPSALALCLENTLCTLFDHPQNHLLTVRTENSAQNDDEYSRESCIDSLAMSTLAYSKHIVECTQGGEQEKIL